MSKDVGSEVVESPFAGKHTLSGQEGIVVSTKDNDKNAGVKSSTDQSIMGGQFTARPVFIEHSDGTIEEKSKLIGEHHAGDLNFFGENTCRSKGNPEVCNTETFVQDKGVDVTGGNENQPSGKTYMPGQKDSNDGAAVSGKIADGESSFDQIFLEQNQYYRGPDYSLSSQRIITTHEDGRVFDKTYITKSWVVTHPSGLKESMQEIVDVRQAEMGLAMDQDFLMDKACMDKGNPEECDFNLFIQEVIAHSQDKGTVVPGANDDQPMDSVLNLYENNLTNRE